MEQLEIKISPFDDRYYENYIHSNNFISKEDILNLLSDDIIKNLLTYIEQCKLNNTVISNEIRFGYIIITEYNNNTKKQIDKLLRYIILSKNSEFYVKSQWELLESREENKVKMDKVKVKLLIRINSKEECIKKMSNELIHGMRKSNKKTVDYLRKIDTKNKKQ